MDLSLSQLEHLAAELRFQAEPLEKVLHLLSLLEGLRSHPFLRERLVLKGGTALNLFAGDLPRLSVDIDLNYIGAADRATMLAERPTVERAVEDVCSRQGILVRRAATAEHAGGKWRLGYRRASGGTATLELDLNFLHRQPLFDLRTRDSIVLGTAAARDILVLDDHELAAGKLAALFGRDASRDLFDAHVLLRRKDLDVVKLRLGFVCYAACSREDLRGLNVESAKMTARDAERMLLPLLRADLVPARGNVEAWVRGLVEECRGLLSQLLPFSENELEFLSAVGERGVVAPELLTEDMGLRERILAHPGLAWKAQNVRRHGGLDEPSGQIGVILPDDAEH